MLRYVVALIAVLFADPCAAQFSSGGGIGQSTNAINPLAGFNLNGINAAGVNTATTGTITTGTASLAVASATGWSVGMGIAVANAGTGGNTELITTVTAISGTTFTLANNAVTTATGQTVNHDDTVALSAAITLAMSSGRPVYCSAGNYNVTSALASVTVPIDFTGAGTPQCTIINRGKTNDVFVLTWQYTFVSSILGVFGGNFSNFQVMQAAGITPTAGCAFNIAGGGGAGPNHLESLTIDHVMIQATWCGMSIGNFVTTNWFTSMYIADTVSWGVLYNSAQPAGDNWFQNIEIINGLGFEIVNSDTMTILNLKLNTGATGGAALVFAAAASTDIIGVRIINPSIEGLVGGSTPTCGVDFGTNGANRIQIIGGGIGFVPNTICNADKVVPLSGQAAGLEMIGVQLYNSTNGPIGNLTVSSRNTVAQLPTCSAQTQGARSFVTDQNTAVSYRGAVTGGGATKQGVICDGTNWLQD